VKTANRARIFLVGMTGVGKSTLGKKLASHLHYSFIDLDNEIVKLENATIESIFKTKGEAYFRQIEQTTLLQSSKLNQIVIATGGGTPCYGNNIEWMNANGKTIYLKATPSFIVSRLPDDYQQRPLLKDITRGDLLPFIEKLLESREYYYDKANSIVQMPIKSVSSIVKSVRETDGID